MKKEVNKFVDNLIEINQEYVDNRPLSPSSLKEFAKSPRHYLQYVGKKRTPPTDAQLLGSVVDCLLLEPEKFKDRFRIYEKFSRRSAADKEKWANLVKDAQKDRVTLITPEVKKQAEICVDAVWFNPEARALLEGKRFVQKHLKWKELSVNLKMNGYIDFDTITANGHFIVDLKTTRDASYKSFSRDIVNLDYDIQAAAYCRGFHKTRFEFPQFAWLAVETSEPYGVNVIKFDPKDLEVAKGRYYALLQGFRKCLDEDKFHEDYKFWLMETRDSYYFRYPAWVKNLIGVEEGEFEDS